MQWYIQNTFVIEVAIEVAGSMPVLVIVEFLWLKTSHNLSGPRYMAVSYTHLTLPTIYSV